MQKRFYYEHLVQGGPADSTEGRQALFAELLVSKVESVTWTPRSVRSLAKEAAGIGCEVGESLCIRLNRIAAVETILAPVSDIYAFLQTWGRERTSISNVAECIRQSIGDSVPTVATSDLDALKTEMGGDDSDSAQRWFDIGNALASGKR